MFKGGSRIELGRAGEAAAEKFLRRQRYAILARNYRCPFGEVDLVALDGRVVVFVEVRSRAGTEFGGPLESINRRKQEQVIKAALHFLSRHHLHAREARFDVIGIKWEGKEPEIEHLKNAFELPAA
jgi:putative endonuclease